MSEDWTEICNEIEKNYKAVLESDLSIVRDENATLRKELSLTQLNLMHSIFTENRATVHLDKDAQDYIKIYHMLLRELVTVDALVLLSEKFK